MNILDIIIVVLLLFSIWRGYRTGLVGQLVRVASVILSFIVAFMYYRPVAAQLAEWFPLSKVQANGSFDAVAGFPIVQQALYNLVAFALLAFVVGLAVRLVGGFLDGITRLPGISLLNRLVGAVVGLVKNGLILFIILAVASLLPSPAVQQSLSQSLFASYAQSYSSDMVGWVKDLMQNPLSPTNGDGNGNTL